MKNYIIILAAGCGQRLESELPKQFLPLAGTLPILMHTISAFSNSAIALEIVVVMQRNQFNFWKHLCLEHNFSVPHILVEGGTERFHSVKRALDSIDGNGFVGVHDGVRPFVSEKLILDTFQQAFLLGNATPAVSAVNTIRYFDGTKPSVALDRKSIYIVQNPQVFRLKELKAAYQQDYVPFFTDDATVAEEFGIKINLVEGDRRNIKITNPIDLYLSESIITYNLSLLQHS